MNPKKTNKITILDLIDKKKAKGKITMLTAYDHPMAKILDEVGVDIILIGDSLGNVILGYENTLPVTMDEMMHHTKAVSRAVKNSLIVSDMPFSAFQAGPGLAYWNASKLISEGGANAVKIEGVENIKVIKDIIAAGIPVMGHLGFTPQSINRLGGAKVQGRDKKSADKLISDAKLLQKAGVFALVLELVPAQVAKKIQKALKIPVISCGAGKYCDGQVLVINDLIGLSDKKYKFVKQYVNLSAEIKRAVANFIMDVEMGRFPGEENSF
ncbi:MAG: 3-methyl-2-oxobutanoate hydroxymethyltransferase [bacterium]